MSTFILCLFAFNATLGAFLLAGPAARKLLWEIVRECVLPATLTEGAVVVLIFACVIVIRALAAHEVPDPPSLLADIELRCDGSRPSPCEAAQPTSHSGLRGRIVWRP